MEFYSVLTAATVAIVYLAFAIWGKTRSIGFPLGVVFLYLWSLYGAWSIVIDGLGGNSGRHYHYLFSKLFVISLDEAYFKTLLLYSLFIIVIETTVLLYAKPWSRAIERPLLSVSHERILWISLCASALSYLIIRPSLSVASAMNLSAYLVTRSGGNEFFSIHQVLNRVALVPLAIGFAAMCSGENPRMMAGGVGKYTPTLYLMALAWMFYFCLLLGNKNELLYSLVAAVLFYLSNARKPRWMILAGTLFVAFMGLALIDYTRGTPLSAFLTSVESTDIIQSARFLAASDEAFGAHFSMYGALKHEIPLTYGSSFVSLAASIVPRLMWPTRPFSIYEHYADSIGAVSGQGYSIHHATGWFLNFGIFGIISGAIVWGWLWARLHNLYLGSRIMSTWKLVCGALLFFTFTANIPNLVRAGPEGYKGFVIDAFVIPVGVFFVAMRKRRQT